MNELDYKNNRDESVEELPSRREYHRNNRHNKAEKKKKGSPFLLARLLLTCFLILVLCLLGYSIFY